ncbi:MAG TPA: alpha/beta hydrolase [Nitrososphaeraceae archaeon]|nr:alpha/beta hydrolase [Nitrososphaeraceae archaeon]
MMLRIFEKLNDMISRIKVNIQLTKAITLIPLTSLIVFTSLLILLSLSIAPATSNALSLVDQSIDLRDIETKKIRVDDIEMAYKMFGNGPAILLINGYSAPLDFWDPLLINKLASNHTVITLDNRGIGNTSSGSKEFSIPQFAQDTVGLMDALKIDKADILGWSMGAMVAQELTISNPDKVNKLIIYASICGGNDSIPPKSEAINTFSNQTENTTERLEKFLPLLFPEQWRIENPNLIQSLPRSTEISKVETLNLQIKAITTWEGTCDRLNSITNPTMVLVGTDDVLTVPENSMLMASKITGSWLIQIEGGGHAVMMQYPEKVSSIIDFFLTS